MPSRSSCSRAKALPLMPSEIALHDLVGELEHRSCNTGHIGMTINRFTFQDVPGCDEQISGDCHDLLGATQTEFESDELFFQKG